MTHQTHSELVQFIWNIANKLRGPYRPPQYRRVMLPMIVLRRLDCVLEPTREKVLAKYEELKKNKKLTEEAIGKMLAKTAGGKREQPLYNLSKYDFQRLLNDSEGIARNLTRYIRGFSPNVRQIFEHFNFDEEITRLDNANRLYTIVQEFSKIDLHPERISNLQMGYVFEELVRKFNEQANEEAGDHFTPREVIRLMTNLVYTGEEVNYEKSIVRKIYDPACGTGGMLSVSEEFIRRQNPDAHLVLFGQEYNAESYAICCSDLLIKDEAIDKIIFGDTLGDGKTRDGHEHEKFHYMLSNPPFGVEWKAQQAEVEKEHEKQGFRGRFGPGLPRINDGSLLFLLHMISKMHSSPEEGGEGSKIAVVFNGSPLFTGDAGSGESNIRRWIIENDLLDAIIALPDQMFYNTGIYTYIWLVTNRKPKERRGKVQLIDGTRHFKKMDKSLGNKRNELADAHIEELTRLYGDFRNNATSKVKVNGKEEKRVCTKIFDNRDFGFLKITVERPLRLNFAVTDERIEKLKDESAFQALAGTQKRKDKKAVKKAIEEGEQKQQEILAWLEKLKSNKVWKDREAFVEWIDEAMDAEGIKLDVPVRKALLNALSERDETAEICRDRKGNPEPDSELRDTELVPLPKKIKLPLPLDYDKKSDNTELVKLVKDHCEEYLKKEVLPHVPDAWIDYSKTKVGYEIPFNRHFYVYEPPRPLEEIEKDIFQIESEIADILNDLKRA